MVQEAKAGKVNVGQHGEMCLTVLTSELRASINQ